MSKIIFYLNTERQEIDFSSSAEYSPTTTVLNYLRSLSRQKGTKEGCGEGDCGACTVVVAEPEGKRLKYSSITSCIVFLPMLHGKQLITVEHLESKKGLHPVQQSMVELDASQCGFCTPGFAMSIFSLYKAEKQPSKEDILDELTGNLCRCTGYRPIIDVANTVCANQKEDKFSESEADMIINLAQISDNYPQVSIAIPQNQYFAPSTVENALRYLEKYPDCTIISGASDESLRITKKNETIPNILDLSRIKTLKSFSNTSDKVIIGAGLSLEAIRKKTVKTHRALSEMLSVFGSKQIRNKATLGGNLGSASPIGDTIPVLMSYDAEVEVQSLAGKRIVPVTEFVTGYRKTVIATNEIITAVVIPQIKSDNTFVRSYKISKRRNLDISTVSAGFRLVLKEKMVESVKLYFGGMAAYVKSATNTEKFLVGKSWTKENIVKAMKLIKTDFSPISDARSSGNARLLMTENLILKFYNDTF